MGKIEKIKGKIFKRSEILHQGVPEFVYILVKITKIPPIFNF
jgi:hypothetical protein